jgi:murein tripeptide amidase MpaA
MAILRDAPPLATAAGKGRYQPVVAGLKSILPHIRQYCGGSNSQFQNQTQLYRNEFAAPAFLPPGTQSKGAPICLCLTATTPIARTIRGKLAMTPATTLRPDGSLAALLLSR